MADQLDPRQIDSLTDAINNLNATMGGKHATVQAADIKNFEDLGKSLKGSLTDFGNFKKAVTLGSAALSKMSDSVDGVSRFTNEIESAADTVATLGVAVATLVGGPIGLLIAGFGAAVLAGAKYTKAVAKQADDLYKSYQDISRAGVVGAAGVNDIFKNMQKLGYGIEELGKMGELLKENSENLAQFGGTALKGTRTLADMSKGISDSGLSEQFLRLGITVDAQNRGMAGYLKLQTMTGQAGLKTQEQLTAAAAAYIDEQDKLTKLTGMSSQKQQEVFERAASEERLGAKLRQLEREGRGDEAKKLRQAYAMAEGLPKLQKGIADVATGYIGSSKEAQDMLRTMPDAVEQFQSANVDLDAAFRAVAKGAKETNEQFDPLRMAVGDNIGMLSGRESAEAVSRFSQGLSERTADIEAERNKAKAGDDAATKALVGNELQQRKARDELQLMREKGIVPVTKGLEGLQTVLSGITGAPGKVAPSLAAPRQPPGTTPGGRFDAAKAAEDAKKGVKEGVKEGIKAVPPAPAAQGLGSVSKLFESAKGGAGTVANTAGDFGGASYGTYQMSSKMGQVQEFLKSNDKYGKQFEGLKAGTAEFDKKWKELGGDKGFEEAQEAFAKQKYYDQQVKTLGDLGKKLTGKGRGVQEALFSTGVQYGGGSKVIEKALAGKDVDKMSEQDVINSIQDYKSQNVGTNFKSSSEAVQRSVSSRIERERSALLGLAGPAAGYQSTAMAGVNPNTALATNAQAANQQPAPNSPEEAQNKFFSQMLDRLDLIARSSSQQVATNKKMLAAQT